MDETLLKRVKKYANHFVEISGVDTCVLNLRERKFYEAAPAFCRDSCPCKGGDCDCFQVHLRNCLEAERWDGRYTYYCPLNLIFVAACCTTRMGIPTGVVAGPFLLDELDRESFPSLSTQALEALLRIPIMSTSKAYHFGETLAALLTCCGVRDRGFSPTENRWELINKMFRFATSGEDGAQTGYSIEMERRLGHMISDGDNEGARQQINQVLSYIALSSGENVAAARARCTELLVMMSRAAIDAGAEIDTIFVLNEKYFEEFSSCATVSDMGVWLSTAASGYASYVQDAAVTKHSYAVSKAISFIRQNYASKITLEGTAKMVYLSRSYFSKLFAEETGVTFSNYVIRVRIGKSKQLLLDSSVKLADVAYLVGFVDQSYFTKCFRKLVGISPGKYRNCQGKVDENTDLGGKTNGT